MNEPCRAFTVVLAVSLVAVFAASPWCAEQGRDFAAYEMLRTGRQELRAGDAEKAVKAFAGVIEEFPDTPEAAQAAIEMGRVYEGHGELTCAEATYMQARQSAHARWASEAGIALAELYLKQEKTTAAAETAQAVADANADKPMEGRAWVALARVRAAQGRPEDAQTLIERAVERYPDERWVPSALLTLCRMWHAASHRTAEQMAYARLLTAHPRSLEAMEARYLRAVPRPEVVGPDAELHPLPEQLRDLEWLVVLCPDCDLVARAIWDLSRYQEAAPSGWHFFYHPREAELVLLRYFNWDWPEFEPWCAKAHLRLAELLRKRDCDEEAAEELQALLRDYPGAPEVAQAREMLKAMRPTWVDLAAALEGTGAQLVWNGESEFAAIRLKETYVRYAIGFSERDEAQRTLHIGLQAGWPYAVVWGHQVGFGWGPQVRDGRYLVSRAHLEKLLKRYDIEPAQAPTLESPKSGAARLMERAREILDQDPHGAFQLYDAVAGRYPNTAYAAHARFEIALHKYEIRGQAEEALRRYQRIAEDFPRSDWAARARIRMAELEYCAGRIGHALAALHRVAADFAATPLCAEAMLVEAKLYSARREHARAQRICAQVADAYAGWPVAAEALQWAGYSGLWSDESLEAFGYFERIIAEYPYTPQMPDAVYYTNWHNREFVRAKRDWHWTMVYDPDPDRYQRRLGSGGYGMDGLDVGWEHFLESKRSLETPLPAQLAQWRGWAVHSVALFYHMQRRYASMLDVIEEFLSSPASVDDATRERLLVLKERYPPPRDLIALNARPVEEKPAGHLIWDGHSEDAVFVGSDGTQLHLRDGDDFGWAGGEFGVYWRVRIEDGSFLVSREGLAKALSAVRNERLWGREF